MTFTHSSTSEPAEATHSQYFPLIRPYNFTAQSHRYCIFQIHSRAPPNVFYTEWKFQTRGITIVWLHHTFKQKTVDVSCINLDTLDKYVQSWPEFKIFHLFVWVWKGHAFVKTATEEVNLGLSFFLRVQENKKELPAHSNLSEKGEGYVYFLCAKGGSFSQGLAPLPAPIIFVQSLNLHLVR